jgi:membrane protein
VSVGGIKRALGRAYQDVVRHHTLQVAAALSYYFVLSIFPCLIFLSAVVAFIPLPDLFGRVLLLMNRLLPGETMRMVYSVLGDVLSSRRGTWLSFGMLGTIWTASAAFDSMIEALDIAYDVTSQRPMWKSRLLAIGLAGICGLLLLAALAVMVVGPLFGEVLAIRFALPTVLIKVWPLFRWTLTICFTILVIEVLYFVAPNVKQRFGATLPGAVLTVVAWNGLSYLLALYFHYFANFNRTYGTLGGFIALMIWLYWTSFVLLVGAELNAELAKASKKGRVEPRNMLADDGQQAAPLDRAA